MSGSQVISNFSQEVSMALTKALETKGKELDERETALNKKEAQLKQLEDYMKNIFSNHYEENQQVTIQVGNCCFETTFDVLLSHSNSYFHKFQWAEDKKLTEAPSKIFIARNPKTFIFVLEYLTYGKLFSQIRDQGLLEMLKCDAQFYGLKELANNVQELIEVESDKIKHEKAKLEFAQFPLFLETSSTSANENTGFFSWNSLKELSTHFQYDGINTYTILKKCLTQVSMTYVNTSSNGSVALLVNNVAVSRCYHSVNTTGQINKVYEFEINDKINFQYSGHSGYGYHTSSDVLATTLTFVVLHTY